MASLSKEHTELLRKLLSQGASLSEAQNALREAGAGLTYMELRLAVADLDLAVAEKPEEKKKEEPTPTDKTEEEATPEGTFGELSVELDPVTRAGTLASGSVTFSDSTKASWMLDEMGRLGLVGAPKGYQPSQTDLMAFQQKLRALLESRAL